METKKSIGSAIGKFIRTILMYGILFVIMVGVGVYIKDRYFTVHEVITIETDTLESQVKSIGELATVEYDYKDSLKIQEGKYYIDERLAIITFNGVIKAGVDTDQMEIAPTKDDEGNLISVDIKLPDARVVSHEINNEKTIIDEDSLLGKISNKKRNNAIAKAQLRHQLEFAVYGYIDLAYESATKAITNLIETSYGKGVQINFERIPTDASKLKPEEKILRLCQEYPELVNEEGSNITSITEDMINFFYDNYYGHTFKEVMTMYVDEFAPTDIKDELDFINQWLEDTGLSIEPLWIFNMKDGNSNDNYLYYELYVDDKATGLVCAFVYDADTKEVQTTFIEIEHGSELSDDYLDFLWVVMSYSSDEIHNLEEITDVIDYLNDAVEQDYELEGYVYHYYEDDGEFIAIIPVDVWEGQ